ncbi:unnamed protein product [Tenebrio molitor]|nr:unnamed protein product [Tenebrio molitor]
MEQPVEICKCTLWKRFKFVGLDNLLIFPQLSKLYQYHYSIGVIKQLSAWSLFGWLAAL